MSNDTFKAQSSPQSIGATSIISAESFGSTNTLAYNTKVILSSGIISRQNFPVNSSITNSTNLTLSNGITSTESLLNNNTFSQGLNISLSSIPLRIGDESPANPSISSAIGITLSSVGSSENIPSQTVYSNSSIELSGNGISSLEYLDTHTLNFINYLIQESSISSEQVLVNNNFFALNNSLYPSAIETNELLESNNIFGINSYITINNGISSIFTSPSDASFSFTFTARTISVGSGITSRQKFGTRIIFFPPPPSILDPGNIFGYVIVPNSINISLERENILAYTTIPRRVSIQQTKSQIINSYIENALDISSTIDVVYDIENEITIETNVIARQSKHNLESYIKQKYSITSFIEAETNDTFYTVRSLKIN